MKKICQFLLLVMFSLCVGYTVVMGMDKQAEINELKADQWKVQREVSKYDNNR